MPVYAYKCKNCGRQFDVKQRFSEEPLTDCPHCQNGRVRRVISPVGVVFKGSGFYVTDNRNGKSSIAVDGSGKSKTEEKSTSEEKPKASKKSDDTSKTRASKPASTSGAT